MLNEIICSKDVELLMIKFNKFHDSCIKEMKYVSGAYVDNDLSMNPINSQRMLYLLIQSQSHLFPTIELCFSGLKFMKMKPVDESYTCEIFSASIIYDPDKIIWCDTDAVNINEINEYDGTVICATKLSWRVIDDFTGNDEFYIPKL